MQSNGPRRDIWLNKILHRFLEKKIEIKHFLRHITYFSFYYTKAKNDEST